MGRKNTIKFLICLIAISSLQSQAQALYGTTGLLHAPTAEMQKDKTFMVGGNVLHLVPLQYLTTNEIKYTFNYYLNITIFPWLEVGYTCTINYAEHGSTYFPEQFLGKVYQSGPCLQCSPAVVERRLVEVLDSADSPWSGRSHLA